MEYIWATLWHDRRRFIPAILAVAFSGFLAASQAGLVVGTLDVVSLPVDRATADVWVAARDLPTIDAGMPIPLHWMSRLNHLDIERIEPYIRGVGAWQRQGQGTEKCVILGMRLNPTAIGAPRDLTPEMRARLSEPGAVVVDRDDLGRLGLAGTGEEIADIRGRRVRVVGTVNGFKGLGSAHVLCSLETARLLLMLSPEQATFLVAGCKPGTAPEIVRALRGHADMSAFSAADLSLRSRLHWLSKTGAGVALGLAAGLGLVVGAVVTSQTLFAATAASAREYAVLRAMGIPRWRIRAVVIMQSLCVGMIGTALAVPAILLTSRLATTVGATIRLPGPLLVASAAIMVATAVVSGLFALRSVRLVEPSSLLR